MYAYGFGVMLQNLWGWRVNHVTLLWVALLGCFSSLKCEASVREDEMFASNHLKYLILLQEMSACLVQCGS